jgi:hypothetical protein
MSFDRELVSLLSATPFNIFHRFVQLSNVFVQMLIKKKHYIDRIRQIVTLDKTIYVGFTVLELSKVAMYKFHYEVIVSKCQSAACLLFTDIDSLRIVTLFFCAVRLLNILHVCMYVHKLMTLFFKSHLIKKLKWIHR